MDAEQIHNDIKYLLSFAPAQDPKEVEPGLGAMFYISLTYEGDIKIAERIKEIRDRYDVSIDEDDEDMVLGA